jgi:hypothetical protein
VGERPMPREGLQEKVCFRNQRDLSSNAYVRIFQGGCQFRTGAPARGIGEGRSSFYPGTLRSCTKHRECRNPQFLPQAAQRQPEGFQDARMETSDDEISNVDVIFGAHVHFDVLDVTERQGRTIVRVKIEGTFDRTGLPDPLVMKHEFKVAEGKIAELRIGF